MTSPFRTRWSISAQLLLLIAAAALPLLGALAYDFLRDTRRSEAQLEGAARQLARITAADADRFLADTQTLLGRIAAREGVQAALEGAPCDPLFATFLDSQQRYANLILIGADGRARCSSWPLPARPVSFSGISALRTALETGTFRIGAPSRGPITGRWGIPVAYPILVDGEVRGVIAVSIDLIKFHPLVTQAPFVEGTHVTIFTRDRQVVADSVDSARLVGRDSDAEAARIAVAVKSGAALAQGMDGQQRVHGFEPAAGDAWIVAASFPAAALDAVRAKALAGMVYAALALSTALFVAMFVSRRIRRPIERIAAVAQAVRKGEAGVRAPVDGASEIRAVAESFNSMLEAVEEQREALRQSEQTYRNIFNENRAIKLVLDPHSGAILEANRAAADFYGYGLETLRSMHLCDINLRPAEELQRLLQKTTREPLDGQVERHRLASSDIRFVEIYAAPTQFHGRLALYAIIHDVTARTLAEDRIRELNERLEQRVRQRTAELEQAKCELEAFAYSVSHDLRAPLRAINGFARLVQEVEAPRLSVEGRDNLARVMRNAVKMGELIDDMLEFSRLGRADLHQHQVALAGLAAAAATELRDIYPKTRVLIGDLPIVRGDEPMLRQAMENLLSNAFKFSSNRADACVEVGCRGEAGETLFFVRDNGAGFDMLYAGKLFGVFQRMHRETEFPGTGVGLAIVKRIVERHGGRIWAESAPGQGATFYFTLGHGPCSIIPADSTGEVTA